MTYADWSTSPDGEPMDVEDRLADMLRRHGPDSRQPELMRNARP